MAVAYSNGRFHGGRLSPAVERVLATVIGAELSRSRHVTIRLVHEQASAALWACGLRAVSPGAISVRMTAFGHAMSAAIRRRVLFNRQIPLNVRLVDESGFELGRPLVTLSGRIEIDGDGFRLKTNVELSMPRVDRAGREPSHARGTRFQDLATLQRRARVTRSMRGAFPDRIDPHPTGADDDAFVLDLVARRSPLPFRKVAEAMGSASIARAAVRRLIDAGLLDADTGLTIEGQTLLRCRRRLA